MYFRYNALQLYKRNKFSTAQVLPEDDRKMPQRTDKKTICLNMIVKNEAAIIRDTLENIIAHVPLDYYVISDTGSDDNTADIIEQFFAEKGIQGEIHHDEWVNFAHNRNCASTTRTRKNRLCINL